MTGNRIERKFAHLREEGRTGLILYLMAGYPSMELTEQLAPALLAAGADGIEIGVPFSDPLADGATVQAAGFHALSQGVTLQDCVELTRRLRPQCGGAPLMLMGYYNPILSYGLDRFCDEAADASVDGLIVPDLPAEEAAPLADAAAERGIALIPLLAPTSPDWRIEMVCEKAGGFIYCVSVTGVTGARKSVGSQAPDLVARVKRRTDLPVGVGFGVSTAEHFQAVGEVADAAIVGSALLQVIRDAPADEAVERASRFVAGLKAETVAATNGGAR